MGAQNDQWIANVASYVRNEFGNSAPFISAAEVARVRASTPVRKTMWTYPELEVTLPRLIPVDPTWKATASHNAERAPSGLTLGAWTSGTAQTPDMWFQVELPQATMVTEVTFDAGQPGGGGRGRGGRGGAPPAPAAGRGAAPAIVPGAPNAGAPPVTPAPAGGRISGPPSFGSFPIGYKIQLSMDCLLYTSPSPRD